ncbi:alpha-mannosidase, partial [Microbacterium testaceum]|uniref:glycoside hydrolase family 38 C-terminal domain-containing protein n=1 Tax=Microbacterium testaceum TaxID=2033 RepID=UPI0007962D72
HRRGGAPALGIATASATRDVAPRVEGEGFVLDNGIVHAVIDSRGLIISLVEVASGREVVPEGQTAGLFELFRDTPTQWDAWDIDETYRRHVTPLDSAQAVRIEGDAIVVERALGDSHLVTRIALAAGARVVRLSIDVDWHEQQKLLKLGVPVDVHTDRAASEIQFGHITRPTHTNTSWDAARFETAAHRWVRVGEPG